MSFFNFVFLTHWGCSWVCRSIIVLISILEAGTEGWDTKKVECDKYTKESKTEVLNRGTFERILNLETRMSPNYVWKPFPIGTPEIHQN